MDLISRQAVIDEINIYLNRYKKYIGTLNDSELYAHSRGLILSIEMSIKALPSAEPEWIPVKEKLPNDEQRILLSSRNGVELVIWDEDSKRMYHNCKDLVAAWMPLPEPYKTESGNKE